MMNDSRTRGAARFDCDADQAASSAARSSVFAATDISLDGQTGLLIGPEARPAPAFRGADDPQTTSGPRTVRR